MNKHIAFGLLTAYGNLMTEDAHLALFWKREVAEARAKQLKKPLSRVVKVIVTVEKIV